MIASPPPRRKSLLVPFGIAVTIAGAGATIVARILERQLEELSEFLLLAVVSVALGVFLGPVLWLMGVFRQRRFSRPYQPPSLKLWLPIAVLLFALNTLLSYRAHGHRIFSDQIVAFVATQVLLIPGFFALLSLVFRAGRSAARAAKVFVVVSTVLVLSYLAP